MESWLNKQLEMQADNLIKKAKAKEGIWVETTRFAESFRKLSYGQQLVIAKGLQKLRKQV